MGPVSLRLVSVPFSMGTVLHPAPIPNPPQGRWAFQSPSRWGRCCIDQFQRLGTETDKRFSPLLDGDGVASLLRQQRSARASPVSVPFSMGTVLHPSAASAGNSSPTPFQSPSRWGRCCISAGSTCCRCTRHVSVPFSMGTVLHRAVRTLEDLQAILFQSPSRWGRCCIGPTPSSFARFTPCFSPLLDGDGVAS